MFCSRRVCSCCCHFHHHDHRCCCCCCRRRRRRLPSFTFCWTSFLWMEGNLTRVLLSFLSSFALVLGRWRDRRTDGLASDKAALLCGLGKDEGHRLLTHFYVHTHRQAHIRCASCTQYQAQLVNSSAAYQSTVAFIREDRMKESPSSILSDCLPAWLPSSSSFPPLRLL